MEIIIRIKHKIIFTLLFILTTIIGFSQSKTNQLSLYTNKENCEKSIVYFIDKLLTQDSSYYIFHSDAYSRTCVFKYDKKIIKYNYDTSYYSDFTSKFGRFGKSHFITKNIGYRQHRINNIKIRHNFSEKYNLSTFFKTTNSGINWDKLVDLDILDREFYHSIDNFYCVDSNVVLLYGKQIKYKFKSFDIKPHLKDIPPDERKKYCVIFPNGKFSTDEFTNIEFSTFFFITYDGGKIWKKLNNELSNEIIDTHRFDINIEPNLEVFKTGNIDYNIENVTHNPKTRQIIITNKKNNRFYVNY
jgi:hypothetical protein